MAVGRTFFILTDVLTAAQRGISPISGMTMTNKPTKACFVAESFVLVITTDFIGPDKLPRSMSVSGIPNERLAQAFLKHMGWEDVPFRSTGRSPG
jgi:hypothetical protein